MQLEQNSKQIAQEKQEYIDKLNEAASKLESELEKKQVSCLINKYELDKNKLVALATSM